MKKISLVFITSLLLCSCVSNSIDDKRIIVGASSTPHALILEQTKEYVQNKGYTLDIKVMTDYVTPNIALSNGEIDANYFQHQPYLDEFNANYKTDIVGVKGIHFEPMRLFKGTATNNKIAIPNDKSNGDRAKDLLIKHFVTYDQFQIVEMEASVIPMVLSDVAYVCVNGNYALDADLFNNYELVNSETSEDEIASKLANIIAVQRGHENKESIKVLVDAITQDSIRSYIETEFKGAIVATF